MLGSEDSQGHEGDVAESETKEGKGGNEAKSGKAENKNVAKNVGEYVEETPAEEEEA